jgi:TolA-binding protein
MLKMLFTKTAPLFALWVLTLMPPASIAIEDCGASSTECEFREQIEELQKQLTNKQTLINGLKSQIEKQHKQIGDLQTQLSDFNNTLSSIRQKMNTISVKSGNVGIGTTTPQAKLEVAGQAKVSSLITTGNVGIGTNSPSAKLEVAGQAKVGSLIATGKVGIGTTTPRAKLDVKGTVHVNKLRIGYWEIYQHQHNGGLYFAKGNKNYAAFNNYGNKRIWDAGKGHISDLRFKTNFKPLLGVTDKLAHVRAVYFTWNDHDKVKDFDKKTNIGLIADELEKVFPELVFFDDEGYRYIDYEKVSAVLLAAIKELHQLILKNKDNHGRALEQIRTRLNVLETEWAKCPNS